MNFDAKFHAEKPWTLDHGRQRESFNDQSSRNDFKAHAYKTLMILTSSLFVSVFSSES